MARAAQKGTPAESLKFSLPARARIGARRNVGGPERVLAGVLGGWLTAIGIKRRSWVTLPLFAAGAELLRRAATGHCPVYSTLGFTSAGLSPQRSSKPDRSSTADDAIVRGYEVKRTVTVNRAADQIAAQLRDPAALLRKLPGIENLVFEGGRLTFAYAADNGRRSTVSIGFDAPPNAHSLAWHGDVDGKWQAHGLVWLAEAPGDRGTEVTLALSSGTATQPRYVAGGLLATLHDRRDRVVRHYLRAAKQVLETGHVSTAEIRGAAAAGARRLPPAGELARPQPVAPSPRP